MSQKRRRVRHHINPLQTGYAGILPTNLPPQFEHIALPLEVEFGCADAQFLFERAKQKPDAFYIGIEIRREMIRRVNKRAKEENINNVQGVFANLNHDLPALFGTEQIQRIFVNFPDPWFKKSQHKRRVVQPEWAMQAVAFLRPGGELFFQSDVFDLALDAMCVLEQTPGLRNVQGEWSFLCANPYQAQSLREVRVLEKGLPVWRILYKKEG